MIKIITGYGLNFSSEVELYEPETAEETTEFLSNTKSLVGVSIMGSGLSYGDAFFPNESQNSITISTKKLKARMEINHKQDLLTVSAGFTLNEVLNLITKHGYILESLPGIGEVSIGGAIATNVHGKNSWKVGNFNKNVVSVLTCDRYGKTQQFKLEEIYFKNLLIGSNLFILEATIRIFKKPSFNLQYKEICFDTIENGIKLLLKSKNEFEFIVGWVDCFNVVDTKPTGRGFLTLANFTVRDATSTSTSNSTFEVNHKIFGLDPVRFWKIVRIFYNDRNLKSLNSFKYHTVKLKNVFSNYHVGNLLDWNFIHHKFPELNQVHYPEGFVEIQAFFPIATAEVSIRKLLEYCNEHKLNSELCGIKIHPPKVGISEPGFSDTESISIGIDIGIKKVVKNKSNHYVVGIIDLVINLGGNLYLTKDSICNTSQVQRMYPEYFELISQLEISKDSIFQSRQIQRYLGKNL